MNPPISSQEQKLQPVRVQFIEVKNGIILKRGSMELKVDGEHAAQVVGIILNLAGDGGATTEELCSAFAAPMRPVVRQLIKRLVDRRILVPIKGDAPAPNGVEHEEAENNLDIFYWNFGETNERVTQRLTTRAFTILGVNTISRQITMLLTQLGVEQLEVVDDPLLANLNLFDDDRTLNAQQWPATLPQPRSFQEWSGMTDPQSLGTLIATSDFGGLQGMRRWNEFAVQAGCHFLPVVLQNLIGYIGPLVIPGDTACFECLRARQNSHMLDPENERAAEAKAFEGQLVAGFHPAMAAAVGDITVIELTKVYGGFVAPLLAGYLVELNLLDSRMRARKVLKVPRCKVCSTLLSHTATNITTSSLVPLNETDL